MNNMNYVEYIQNGQSGSRSSGWSIPLNYHPSTTTNVKMEVKCDDLGWDGYLLVGSMGNTGDYFRFFSYQQGQMVFDCPADSDARLEVSIGNAGPTEWEMGVDGNGDYYLTNLTTNTTATGSSIYSRIFSGDFYVFDDGRSLLANTEQGQKIYYIKIYEGGTLVKEYLPVDNNGTVGLYETIGGTFHTCSNTLIAGPILSSIIATPSKTLLNNTGETITIEVSCENAWTVSGETWLTLSSTGDTGTTTITATAPNYTGTTVRTETLTFTDTVTGDEFVLTLTQKKYQTGFPTFIGLDTIEGIFVGTDEILEAYIGTDLVYASGPFMGLVVKPSSFTLRPNTPSATTVVKSSEYWEVTSLPAWLSASTISGNSGETTVVFENTSQSADTADTITIESANYQADIEANYDDATYTLIDGVRSSSAPSWNLSNHLDTGFYVTGDEDTKFRIKYIGGGVFSDRIVGFDAMECGSDAEDFRYFPEMADAGSCRVNLPSLYSSGQNYDIDFGNLYVYDNINSNMIANYGTCHTINTGTTIRIDMSTNWINEVVISRSINGAWTDIADFKAAEVGGAYGLYDTVNDTFLTKQDLVGMVSQ